MLCLTLLYEYYSEIKTVKTLTSKSDFMSYSRFFFILAFVGNCFFSKSQDLAAYSDYKNYFFVFDAGTTTSAEYLPVQSFQAGGKAVAYIDNTGSLKVYSQGKLRTLSDGTISKYQATDYIVSFSIFRMLSVFDGGKTTLLNEFADYYSTGDSLVAFYDNRNKKFNIYYNGAVTMLEDGMTQEPVQNFKMGDNTFAYLNYLNEFKVFYRGQAVKLTTFSRNLPYEAGRNLVAYCNDTYGFSVFYKGTNYNLESFQPKAFSAGDDMLAYVTISGELNVFYDGKTQTLCSFEPPFYKLTDSLLVYNEAGRFKAFYKGNIYTIENFIPDNYRVDLNTIAYLDQQGRLKTFAGGKTSLITNSRIDEFELYGHVIRYRVYNDNFIYYNSKIYP